MKLLVSLAMVGAIGFAVPAMAQEEWHEYTTQSSIGVTPPKNPKFDRVLTEARAREIMAEFAKCEVDVSPKRIAAAIVLPAGNDHEELDGSLKPMCMEKVHYDDYYQDFALKMSDELYRGALFAELYRRHESAAASGTWGFPIPSLALGGPPLLTAPGEASTNFVMLVLSACLAKRKPDEIRAVVMEPESSDKQNAAFAALVPELGGCVPQGKTIKLTRAVLEAGIGEYLYRSLAQDTVSKSGDAH